LHDRETGRTIAVSVSSEGHLGNGDSDYPSIGAHGTKVAFISAASDLVQNDTNGVRDVFVRDLAWNTTRRVNVSETGEEANDESGVFGVAMSPSGSCVAFDSYASNLVSNDDNGMVDVFIRHLR
jgi:Tol biopolymer transport system component